MLLFVFLAIAVVVSFNESVYSVLKDDVVVQPVLVLSNPSSIDITVQVDVIRESLIGK